MADLFLRRFNRLSPQTKGLWLGLIAMMMFGLTLPVTRLTMGTGTTTQLSPWFVTFGRAVVAAFLSIGFLWWKRAPWPKRPHWRMLVFAALGNVLGYPLLLAFALRTVTASHAAVITALLPLVTAVCAVWMLRQRASNSFWACAAAGTALVVVYSLLRSYQAGQAFHLERADLVLVIAVLAASIGYVHGALVTPELGAVQVICWINIISLPLTLPGSIMSWPQTAVSAVTWIGFAYLGLFSMWLSLVIWYRALAIGGTVRTSQVQLLQPFFAMLFSIPLLSEQLDTLTVGFGAAVVVTVYLGKRLGASSR
ncbi:DMT family transporter [Noviherbaspirillum galbum]|uniref:DMT family transporter n=1 Tax=Noviherbaspirillum galbum TaxID=2709383 RepID=A0A6B3SRW5_9BURK|nr:DMT family transporter [Noviherbaspirillum galbum]NEX63670.1 DMT family transporter [Noviherbaspirillum galbum]